MFHFHNSDINFKIRVPSTGGKTLPLPRDNNFTLSENSRLPLLKLYHVNNACFFKVTANIKRTCLLIGFKYEQPIF